MGSKKLLLYLYLGAKLIKKKEAFTFFSLNMQNFSKKFDVAQLSTINRTIPELCLHPSPSRDATREGSSIRMVGSQDCPYYVLKGFEYRILIHRIGIIDHYLMLEIEKIFSFYLFNRYFALPLQKIYHYGEEILIDFFI